MGRKIELGLGYARVAKASFWNQRKETPVRRICSLKSGMEIARQGTFVNLPAENKDSLVKYTYDNKIVFHGKDGTVNKFIDALNWRVDGELGLGRGYSTLVGAQSGTSNFKKGMVVKTQEDDDELTDIKEGDIINLKNLLFTEKRDYLVKYNGEKVKAEQLVGKVILLYFVPVYLDHECRWEKEWTTSLIEIYNDLLPNKEFEVIFVAVDDLCAESFLVSERDLRKKFESIFAGMPWTAIPFSDIASRKRIARKLSVLDVEGGKLLVTSSVSFDSEGMVLKRDACDFFGEYGTPGYPFTDKRIEFLNSEDDAVAKQPSLELLLASPKRDYVISNKGDRVPIYTLKDKVVALYFYEEFYEDGSTNYRCRTLTGQLKTAYKELAEKNENFEVVFLYLYDTSATILRTNEESFWKTFKTMPWLALPFKDSNHKRLRRIFHYPDELAGPNQAPTLVIFGPNGEFVDPCGADILEKFGTFVYPFTRKRVAQLETKMTKEFKLEMLWDPNTVFREKKYGLQVLPKKILLLGLICPSLQIPFSQFSGKRLLIYFQMDEFDECLQWNSLLRLKDLYLKMKGTYDEFEVIYIKDSSSTKKAGLHSFLPDYSKLPWLVHYYRIGYSLPKELERSFFDLNCYRGRSSYRRSRLLVAFDRDGRIVRKTFHPTFYETEFPFYAGGMEKEYMDHLNSSFQWYYWSDEIIYRRGEY